MYESDIINNIYYYTRQALKMTSGPQQTNTADTWLNLILYDGIFILLRQ